MCIECVPAFDQSAAQFVEVIDLAVAFGRNLSSARFTASVLETRNRGRSKETERGSVLAGRRRDGMRCCKKTPRPVQVSFAKIDIALVARIISLVGST